MKAKSLVTYQAIFKDVICMKLSSALKKGTMGTLQTRLAFLSPHEFRSVCKKMIQKDYKSIFKYAVGKSEAPVAMI